MEALILSCATGGGHNAAAEAVREELVRRGHRADFLDPYTLFGTHRDRQVGGCYIQCAQKLPGLFGGIYRLGELYRRLPGKSPVFWANRRTADRMQDYLERHSYDVILTTHLFAGEILTHLRRRGFGLPKVIYIATDYTCIPFTEEIECDVFVIPSPSLRREFCSFGIAPEKIVPAGIPVRRGIREAMDRETAAARLGLDPRFRYLLLAGGSIGAGSLLEAAGLLRPYLRENRRTRLIVICGSNQRLYRRLQRVCGNDPQILLLRETRRMAEYMHVCDLYISKPGGISSTEAAAAQVPLIHISPIPGCETRNLAFFSGNGMSIGVTDLKRDLLRTVRLLRDEDAVRAMRRAQRGRIDPAAAERIAALAEECAGR